MRQKIHTALLITLTALVTCWIAIYFTSKLPYAYAVGCDSYGYLKQAELFKTHGPIEGLKTATKSEEAKFLLNIASKINPNPLNWSEIIAPHCTHYDKTTQQIILQYPPGTGYFLSLMPEGKELQTLSLVLIFSILIFYIFANLVAQNFKYFFILSFSVYITLSTVLKFQVPSYSVPVTIILLVWIALLLFTVNFERKFKNILIAAALGFLIGLLFDVRIASVLIAPAFVGYLLVKAYSAIQIKKFSFWIPVTGTAFFGLAITPLLISNFVNAGSALSSTYNTYDKEVRTNSLDLFLENFKYYLTDNSASVLAVLALCVMGFQLSGGFSKKNLTGLKILILILVFLADFVFFCLKPIVIDYYFLPTALFCLSLSLLELTKSTRTTQGTLTPRAQIALCSFALVIFLVAATHKIQSITVEDTTLNVPAEILDKNNIIYADYSGGAIKYYKGKYNSKLNFGTFCIQEQLINRVDRSGRAQYFVNDSPKMDELIQALGLERFEKIGTISSPQLSYEVLKLVKIDSKDWPEISCDFLIDEALGAKLDLHISGKAVKNEFIGSLLIANHSDMAFSTLPVAGKIKLSWRFVKVGAIAPLPEWTTRKELNLMFAPQQTHEIPLALPLPKTAGDYKLEITMVQEGFRWFHEHGMKVPSIDVHVR